MFEDTFLDFSEDFGTLDHVLLLGKLKYYGIDKFIRSSLKDEMQVMKIL